MILYRERTQIRLCINITDTDKRVKSYILEYIIILFVPSLIIEICLNVLLKNIQIKNVLLHDHSKR